MKIFIVYAHAEPQSFNGALFRTAQETLLGAGHSVVTSDLYAQKFDPVSDRRNFTTVKNQDFFKQQIEEMHATEVGGFAPDVEAELRKMETCDLMICNSRSGGLACRRFSKAGLTACSRWAGPEAASGFTRTECLGASGRCCR